MPELENSKRQINTATYVQIRIKDTEKDQEDGKKVMRALDKVNYIRSLKINEAEFTALSKLIDGSAHDTQKEELVQLLNIVENLIADISSGSNLKYASHLKHNSVQALEKFGRFLVEARRNLKREVKLLLKKLQDEYSEIHKKNYYKKPKSIYENGDKMSSSEKPILTSQPTLKDALIWAIMNDNKVVNELSNRGIKLKLEQMGNKPILEGDSLFYLESYVDEIADETEDAIDEFVRRMKIEPVGRLHLEKLSMVPAGIERGELLYSVPLSPTETVNISHKEWATKSEEFEKIVQDVFEEYSEEGVAEKKELSHSTDSQQKHASAYTLSGSYSYAGTASVAFGFNSSSEDQQAKKDSVKKNTEITRKSSSRSKKDHKYSFKVESSYGSEDQSVRIIHNPSTTNVMRIDYYQLMRKWRVDLFRHDLRMTYDIVIPSPGVGLIQKLDELRILEDLIDASFEFTLLPSDINADNWIDRASQFGGSIEPPLKTSIQINENGIIHWRDDAETPKAIEVEFQVDQNYVIESGNFKATFGWQDGKQTRLHITGESGVFVDGTNTLSNGDPVHKEYSSKLENLIDKTGNLSLIITHRHLSHGSFHFSFNLKLTDEAFEGWQFASWRAIRDAAEEQYYASRQILIARRDRLTEELEQWDALTLRQMEREEIMRIVLKWILGPDFEFGPPENDLTDNSWRQIIKYGEFIKFIHHAIEWENILYFIYPYFWDSPENWDFKRFLRHPDSRHREFLRAGSARVVLTIRPGFETELTNLLETGGLFAEPDDFSPYLSIAEEIQNFSKTNYPGIPPANPPENYRTLLLPIQEQAWKSLQRLMVLLEKHREENGSYPLENDWFTAVENSAQILENSQELDPWGELWNVASISENDPWDRPWVYLFPGNYGDYDLATFGLNGVNGGEGLDADITSWAEASLIGRWYEYTPTSALDISIDTPLEELA